MEKQQATAAAVTNSSKALTRGFTSPRSPQGRPPPGRSHPLGSSSFTHSSLPPAHPSPFPSSSLMSSTRPISSPPPTCIKNVKHNGARYMTNNPLVLTEVSPLDRSRPPHVRLLQSTIYPKQGVRQGRQSLPSLGENCSCSLIWVVTRSKATRTSLLLTAPSVSQTIQENDSLICKLHERQDSDTTVNSPAAPSVILVSCCVGSSHRCASHSESCHKY